MPAGTIRHLDHNSPHGHETHECGSSAGLDWTKTKEHEMDATDTGQESHHQPCGCLKNRNGAHRDECPDWEAHIDGLDMWWTRRKPSIAPSEHYEDADGEDANGYTIRCACGEEFNDPDNDHEAVRDLLAKHIANTAS